MSDVSDVMEDRVHVRGVQLNRVVTFEETEILSESSDERIGLARIDYVLGDELV